jgi:hypothetical protein
VSGASSNVSDCMRLLDEAATRRKTLCPKILKCNLTPSKRGIVIHES